MSRFVRSKGAKAAMAARTLFMRFATVTGDGRRDRRSNRRGHGVGPARVSAIVALALSGSYYCMDGKPAAICRAEGMGKRCCCGSGIPGKAVKSALKTTIAGLENLNRRMRLVENATAGSSFGLNAHAPSIFTAIFFEKDGGSASSPCPPPPCWRELGMFDPPAHGGGYLRHPSSRGAHSARRGRRCPPQSSR